MNASIILSEIENSGTLGLTGVAYKSDIAAHEAEITAFCRQIVRQNQ